MEMRKSALFLDRDGVVNKNHGYVFEISKFEFCTGIFEICSIAQDAKMPIVIVTNQSGIGRGYFSEEDYLSLTDWMISEFNKQGISIDQVLYAPENPETNSNSLPERRKPSPVMILEAGEALGINLAESILIGDKESDMIAAQRGGIRHRILIGTQAGNTVASVNVENHLQCIEVLSNIVAGIRE
jgi:D-glycero-D-manno-heptose 1,7-bisphosphate phosphatase